MRALLACATILLAAALPAPAGAHDEYIWRHERVRLTEGQARRVAALERRATAAGARRFVPSMLAHAVGSLGDCRLAERIAAGSSRTPGAAFAALYATASGTDRACAARAAAIVAADARRPGAHGVDAANLHAAAILLRRLGNEGRARALLDEAEKLFDAEEAELGDNLWSCHGGDCITSRWSARFYGLRLLHGTPYWRGELQRLAVLAAPGLPVPRGEPSVSVGQRVFEELVREAALHDEEAVGLRIVGGTSYGDSRAYYAARMHALLADGKTEEAIALLPRAGAAFDGGDPRVVAAHFETFAASIDFLTRLRSSSNGLPVQLLRALMERGDFEQARRVVALVAEGAASRGNFARGAGEMAGLAAFLEAPEAPVAHLRHADLGQGRDAAFGELALFLASKERWDLLDAAFVEIRDPELRASIFVDLPCRAAAAGEAAALRGVRTAGPIRTPDDSVDRLASDGMPFQAYLCLLRRGYGEAALAYLEALEPIRTRFSIASHLPIWSTIAESARIRRSQADLAHALAERLGLWGESAAESLAVEYELLGEHERVDAIVERIENREDRARLLVKLIESYVPVPERD